MHVSLYWPNHALALPPPIYVDPSTIKQLMCFGEGEGDNMYYSFQCMSWNETCVLTFSTKFLSRILGPLVHNYQKLTLSYHINCLWQIVWSRGWLCLSELRNEKEEHLKHQQACSWSRWVDLGMSLEEGMDLELQRPSPHRALLYKEILKKVTYKLECLMCK